MVLKWLIRFCFKWIAFGGQGIAGKIYGSQSGSSSQSTHMWFALPMVHCSEELMTLTAAGREYTHIFVERGEKVTLLFMLSLNVGTFKLTCVFYLQ